MCSRRNVWWAENSIDIMVEMILNSKVVGLRTLPLCQFVEYQTTDWKIERQWQSQYLRVGIGQSAVKAELVILMFGILLELMLLHCVYRYNKFSFLLCWRI